MRQVGWIMVLVVAAIQLLAGAAQLVGDTGATFSADTGVPWAELERAYPTVATQWEMADSSNLSGTVAVGAFAVLVCVFGLRTGQRWAWFAMWIVPLYMLPGILGLFSTDNQQAFGWFGLGLVALAVVGLALSIPAVFAKPSSASAAV
ncbi:hypothetical protein [Agromyces sp. SYSU T00266]|uniref:hypothetical protein n=1 Tax=Agromyces zhanjiangensis TaxID=3158562 RepID=UPI003396A581